MPQHPKALPLYFSPCGTCRRAETNREGLGWSSEEAGALDSQEQLHQDIADGTGLSYQELLPIFHLHALSRTDARRAYIRFVARVRRWLPDHEHDALDELVCASLKASIMDVLQGFGSAGCVQLLRARGVRSVNLLTEALGHGLVKAAQVRDILSLLGDGLGDQSPGQQDLRVLLLSHLLRDILEVCLDMELLELCRNIQSVSQSACLHGDTEIALGWCLRVPLRVASDPA